ncbi:hypothetical protein M514_27166 [Trichuris suis]|uniref:Reverse transcriptase Ty1/copia-type domain-containing protein n=1 Tax=Trichuris suis TaxID=68888 RepID=A0A085MTW1_9BILA|nr:hypothetical protein M514_27166 [Trichuris suis]
MYRQAIGSLLYIATVSRLHVVVAVGTLCRRVEKPTESDWKLAKRIMRYLSTTNDFKLRLSPTGDVVLRCYADADWTGDKTDRKSITAGMSN